MMHKYYNCDPMRVFDRWTRRLSKLYKSRDRLRIHFVASLEFLAQLPGL